MTGDATVRDGSSLRVCQQTVPFRGSIPVGANADYERFKTRFSEVTHADGSRTQQLKHFANAFERVRDDYVYHTDEAKMIRIAQRAQPMTNGHFGEYIGKAQPAGAMEIKKCTDKMHTLRARFAKDRLSLRRQQRAVSGRMVTDLDMNGVFRGAAEQFNLASNLRRNDALFPECIRTFPTRFIDTQAFFYRLRLSIE